MRAPLRLQHIDKIGIPVVDRGLGPQFHAGGTFFVRPGGGENPGAERLCKLNGGRADPGRPAMDEKSLARLQPAPHENIGPDGKEGFG